MSMIGLDALALTDDRPTAAVRPLRELPAVVDGAVTDRSGGGLARLAVHLTLAGLPLLAISAHVFGLLPMHLAAALVVLPLTVATGLLAMFDPLAEERIVWRGAVWGAFATAVYDVFRLDTVYLLGWWGDFIPTMGTWVLGTDADATTAGAVAGYLWRYAGDGPGIGIVFFVLAAATGLRRLGRWPVVGASVAFAVFPVWTGLIATVGIAPRGQEQMFPLTATTVTLSLVGHLIFGLVLGLGLARTPDLESFWPYPPLLDLDPDALRARLRPRSAFAVPPAPGLPRAARAAVAAPERPAPREAGSGPRPRPVTSLPGHGESAAWGPRTVTARRGSLRPDDLRAAALRAGEDPAALADEDARAGVRAAGPGGPGRPAWWDGFDAGHGPVAPPPGPGELTMPVPPPRGPLTPPGGVAVPARSGRPTGPGSARTSGPQPRVVPLRR